MTRCRTAMLIAAAFLAGALLGTAPLREGLIDVTVEKMPPEVFIAVTEWRTQDLGDPNSGMAPSLQPVTFRVSLIMAWRPGAPLRIDSGGAIYQTTLIDVGNPWGITPHRILGSYSEWDQHLRSVPELNNVVGLP